jgi:NADH:ubiquinone oxidoreductase subunit 6 (subunit J)
METSHIIFYFISGFTLATALLILFTKSMIRAVFLLMLVFIGVAVIYFISGAEFVGVTQIMIYVGGILILMMFGVMLTSRVGGNLLIVENARIFPGVVAGLGLFSAIAYAVLAEVNTFVLNGKQVAVTTTKQIGISLMTNQILALEIMAILLLVALVGASFIVGNKTIKKSSS